MKYKFPQINSERHSKLIASSWIQIRGPKDLVSTMLASIPLMILSVLPSLIILDIFSPFSLADFGITSSQISITIDFQVLAYIVVIDFIHELIHLVFVPGFLTSDKAFLGITYLGAFSYSEEVLSKSRFTLMLLAPFVVISIILPGILGTLNLLNPLAKFLILLSAMVSGMDILSLILILIQVPVGAYLTCNGMRTYWKRISLNVPESN